MVTRRIRVNRSWKEVKRELSKLPGIISGRLPDPDGLRRFFFAVIARVLFQKIHKAFDTKSKGGTDELGNSWRSLKRSTEKRRSAKGIVAKYPLSAKLYILRMSDSIYNSLAPGNIAGHDYRPSKDQLYELTSAGLRIGTEVEHAKYVNKKRPLWPKKMKPWIAVAVREATNQTIARMAELLT